VHTQPQSGLSGAIWFILIACTKKLTITRLKIEESFTNCRHGWPFFYFSDLRKRSKREGYSDRMANYSKTSASDLLQKYLIIDIANLAGIFLSYLFVVILETIVSGDVMWGLTSIQSQ